VALSTIALIVEYVIFTAVTMKSTVFWVVTACDLGML
jgi:hypothetical protein